MSNRNRSNKHSAPKVHIVKLNNGSSVIGYNDGSIEIQQSSSGKGLIINKDGNIHTVYQNMGGGGNGNSVLSDASSVTANFNNNRSNYFSNNNKGSGLQIDWASVLPMTGARKNRDILVIDFYTSSKPLNITIDGEKMSIAPYLLYQALVKLSEKNNGEKNGITPITLASTATITNVKNYLRKKDRREEVKKFILEQLEQLEQLKYGMQENTLIRNKNALINEHVQTAPQYNNLGGAKKTTKKRKTTATKKRKTATKKKNNNKKKDKEGKPL